MVKKILSEIENTFLNFIDYLKLKSQSEDHILDYLKYVEKQFLFFKDYQDQKDESGVLKLYFLGQSISRYADEFDWGDYSKKKELNSYLDKICELIMNLNSAK